MDKLINIPIDINKAIDQRLFPTITTWNRLEGRPRTHHFDKALKGEVRDALWMICKQWQMGEYKGDDAGSPVFAKIKVNTTSISAYSLGNNGYKTLDNSMPMETLIEQRRFSLERSNNKIGLDIRLQIGQYWNKLLNKQSLAQYYPDYLRLYAFEISDRDRSIDYIYAHQDELEQWMAISGRCIDGFELVKHIQSGNLASSGIALLDSADETILNELGDKLLNYFTHNFTQPEQESENAWLPDRLEYKATCIAEDVVERNSLQAEEYYQGHLDWFAFNLETKSGNATNEPATILDTFIPTAVEFDGMPDRRWWKFEDSKTHFGDVSPSTTDLSKLLLIEFGLTFANDWFLLPFTLPIGTLAEIQGLSVSNNFGEIYWIESPEKGVAQQDAWRIFRQTSKQLNKKVFLCPTALKVQEGAPLEEIYLIRDEMANMVWGIEKIIPSSFGKGIQGAEYALQKRQFHEAFVEHTDPDYKANVYYRAMNSVPENWIPFIPVHADGHKRKVQLQRASMLRTIQGDLSPAEKIKPMSSLLREGLEQLPTAKPYLIHEEEVTRSGTKIMQNFQRTRWLNGQVFVWFGAKKKTGRGEGDSGLAFDSLEDSPKQ